MSSTALASPPEKKNPISEKSVLERKGGLSFFMDVLLATMQVKKGDPRLGQTPIMSGVRVPFLAMPYQANQMIGSTAPISSGHMTTASHPQLTQHQTLLTAHPQATAAATGPDDSDVLGESISGDHGNHRFQEP